MWKISIKKKTVCTQCQMLIHCTGVESCTLFIYNSIEPIIIKIGRDKTFIESLFDRITYFYFNFYLPNIICI